MEEIQKNLAKHGPRLAAYLIDIVPIILLVTAVFYNYFDLDIAFEEYLKLDDEAKLTSGFLVKNNMIKEISFGLWLVYCIVMEASEQQGTFGKQLMKIKVVDNQGQRLSLNHSMGRNSTKVFSYLVLSIGFIWILFDKKRQGWHDKLTDTFVVNDEFKEALANNQSKRSEDPAARETESRDNQ